MKEVVLELLPAKQRYKCVDCEKEYTHIEQCRDGKQRCKRCKKKMVTNIWYDPKYNQNKFIGKFNMNETEISLLIRKYMAKGCSYETAKRKVNYDITCLRNNRKRKYAQDKAQEQNKEIEKQKSVEQNKKFVEGLYGKDRKN